LKPWKKRAFFTEFKAWMETGGFADTSPNLLASAPATTSISFVQSAIKCPACLSSPFRGLRPPQARLFTANSWWFTAIAPHADQRRKRSAENHNPCFTKGRLPMRRVFIIATIFAAILLPAQGANNQEAAATLTVHGDVLNPGPWSVVDLKQKFAKEIQTVKFTSGMDKEQHSGTGIPLVSLLLAAAPMTEKVPKHHDLTFLVILEALDHYRVFFSLAELLPSCGRAQAWLIWDVDGKALSRKEAPVRLAILSDQGHDRYLYGIASITLVDGTKLAAQLSDRR
jgi:hypothetical protein